MFFSLCAAPLLACADLQGHYQPEKSQTQLYLKKLNTEHYSVLIDIPGYGLIIKDAAFVSKQQQNDSVDQIGLPECTLEIKQFGYLMPYQKGSVYRLHFDSQDYEKVIKTDFVLKLNKTPEGIMGVNTVSAERPKTAISGFGQQ